MKKKFLVLGTAMIAAAAITACGGKDTQATTTAETTIEAQTLSEAQTTESTLAAEESDAQSQEKGQDGEDTELADDGAAQASHAGAELETGEIAPFAEKVQKAVADKDMEALAGLCAYPVYVSLGEGEGGEIADEKAFMALDQSRLFTENMLKEIAETDVDTLEQFGAGVIMGYENNVIFNNVDGKAAISGINLQ